MEPCRKPRRGSRQRRDAEPAAGAACPASPAEPEERFVAAHEADPLEQLRFIRETMESAGSFTALPGRGQMLIGFTALAAAALAWRESNADAWLRLWLAEAAIAVLIASIAVARKARSAGQSLLSGPAKKFALSFAPPLLVGALLTFTLWRAGAAPLIPAMWLLLYGTAVITGGAFSVRIVPVMGMGFVGMGVLAAFSPAAWTNAIMALSFGALHIVFGGIIARRHGG